MKRMEQAKRDAKQLLRLCQLNGLLDDSRVRQVVQLLCNSTNRNRFEMLGQFRRLVRLDVFRHRALVESATILTPEFQASVQQDLVRLFGQGLSVSFATNAELIGGMRVKVASDVYDGSVRGRLTALEASFT